MKALKDPKPSLLLYLI